MVWKDIKPLFEEQGWSLHCSTCGKDVFKDPLDYYMLKNKIWEEEICNNDYISKTEVLCKDCAEKILGRKFTVEDLDLEAACNYTYDFKNNKAILTLTNKGNKSNG